jgi:hypothetical protein
MIRTSVAIAGILMLVEVLGTHASAQRPAPPRSALVWQVVSSRTEGPDDVNLLVYRASVPGGWLVSVLARVPAPGRVVEFRPGEVPVSTTFMPDVEHAWRLTP